jgi:membrane protease YdiL (CAAX protease family)
MRPAGREAEFAPSLAVGAWLVAFVVGGLGAAIIVGAAGYSNLDSDKWPLWLTSLTFFPLWVGLLGTLVVVSQRWGTGSFRNDFRLRVRPSDALVGIPIGVVCQLVFVQLLYDALSGVFDNQQVEQAAKSLTDRAEGWGVVLLVLTVAIGAPIVEELFFRGLVLRAFSSRLGDGLAIGASALLFALAHFQPVQFPGLLLFGVVAGYVAHRSGRLGPAIFTHVGFNGTAVVVLLLDRYGS